MLVMITRGTVADGRCVNAGALEDLSNGAAKALILMGKARLPREDELPQVEPEATGGGGSIDEAPQVEMMHADVAEMEKAAGFPVEQPKAEPEPVEQPRRRRGRPRKS